MSKLFFVCFADGELSNLPLRKNVFGLPSLALLDRADIRMHTRQTSPEWFEGWWADAFGWHAQRDLGPAYTHLTQTNVCFTIELITEDMSNFAPLQTAWAIVRWLVARGALFVFDMYAVRFYSAHEINQRSFSNVRVEDEIPLAYEIEPTRGDTHLFHTRGMCRFARPDLLAWIYPSDTQLTGKILYKLAQQLADGRLPTKLQFQVGGIDLTTLRAPSPQLLESLGLEHGIVVARGNNEPLAGITQARSVAR